MEMILIKKSSNIFPSQCLKSVKLRDSPRKLPGASFQQLQKHLFCSTNCIEHFSKGAGVFFGWLRQVAANSQEIAFLLAQPGYWVEETNFKAFHSCPSLLSPSAFKLSLNFSGLEPSFQFPTSSVTSLSIFSACPLLRLQMGISPIWASQVQI